MSDDQGTLVCLFDAQNVQIQRYVKVQGSANPYDPEWETYPTSAASARSKRRKWSGLTPARAVRPWFRRWQNGRDAVAGVPEYRTLRRQRWIFSDRNSCLWWLTLAVESATRQRQTLGPVGRSNWQDEGQPARERVPPRPHVPCFLPAPKA